jgi:hypothetical protein
MHELSVSQLDGLAQLPFASGREAERMSRPIEAVEAISAGLRSGRRLARQLHLTSRATWSS